MPMPNPSTIIVPGQKWDHGTPRQVYHRPPRSSCSTNVLDSESSSIFSHNGPRRNFFIPCSFPSIRSKSHLCHPSHRNVTSLSTKSTYRFLSAFQPFYVLHTLQPFPTQFTSSVPTYIGSITLQSHIGSSTQGLQHLHTIQMSQPHPTLLGWLFSPSALA
jgi:hypothetical protein